MYLSTKNDFLNITLYKILLQLFAFQKIYENKNDLILENLFLLHLEVKFNLSKQNNIEITAYAKSAVAQNPHTNF